MWSYIYIETSTIQDVWLKEYLNNSCVSSWYIPFYFEKSEFFTRSKDEEYTMVASLENISHARQALEKSFRKEQKKLDNELTILERIHIEWYRNNTSGPGEENTITSEVRTLRGVLGDFEKELSSYFENQKDFSPLFEKYDEQIDMISNFIDTILSRFPNKYTTEDTSVTETVSDNFCEIYNLFRLKSLFALAEKHGVVVKYG